MSFSKNIHRRHLNAEDRRKVIAELLKAAPEKSDRQIASETDSNRTTVGQIRKEREKSGDLSIVDTRTDSRGRRQRGHKPPAKKPHEPIKPVAGISTSTTSATVDHVVNAVPELPDRPAAIEEPTEARDAACRRHLPPESLQQIPICICIEEVRSRVAAAKRRIEPSLWPELITKLIAELREDLDRMQREPAQAAAE
jgi:hypothetical protein